MISNSFCNASTAAYLAANSASAFYLLAFAIFN